MDVRDKKVFVGLSGGVDSAVSAALLKEEGALVTGVFIKGWYPPGMPCTWAEDRRDAMRVAAHLRIPFITLDASAAYKRAVIDYLLSEYKAGRTPNPDVMCNREVKFGVFYHFAKEKGADAIATGHYVSGEKDQRYFLWAVPKEILEKTIFPVGGMEKVAVRALAARFGLPNATKKDSQGVCFLGPVSIEEFLEHEFPQSQGEAVDELGKRIGIHNGALLHTIGERVALQDAAPGPWYVLGKDVTQNQLVVGKSHREDVQRSTISFTNSNWFSDASRATCAEYRYRGPRISGRIEGRRFVLAQKLSEGIASGQSVVFYRGEELIGGGIIE